MTNIQIAFLIALMFGVTQATLSRRQFGDITLLSDGWPLVTLVIIQFPLALLSNMGLIAMTIWAFIEMPWQQSVPVFIGGFIVWSLVLAGLLFRPLRGFHAGFQNLSLTIPVILLLQAVTAGAAVYLGYNFL